MTRTTMTLVPHQPPFVTRYKMQSRQKNSNRVIVVGGLVLLTTLFGILSTGHCLDRRSSSSSSSSYSQGGGVPRELSTSSSSSSYTIHVWDSAKNHYVKPHAAASVPVPVVATAAYNNANILNGLINNDRARAAHFNNASSSVVRAKMEVSTSSSTSFSSKNPRITQPPLVHNFNSTVRTQRSSQHPAFINSNKLSQHNHLNLLNNNNNNNRHVLEEKSQQLRNKPILNSLVNKLDTLATKLDRLSHVQVQIQRSFDNLESRYSLSNNMDDVPQCGRRVDRVLRTLTPLVSRVEGLWSIVEGGAGKVATPSTLASPNASGSPPQQQQFLSSPPRDVLLSESRRQERAITAIRSDLNVRSQQIMSELGTVEHQLDLLQSNLRKLPKLQPTTTGGPIIDVNSVDGPPNPPPNDPDSPDIQFTPNDVTFSGYAGLSPQGPIIGNSSRVKSVVFPSVRNKPSSDSSNTDGADALLTGSGQTGASCVEQAMQGNKRSGLYHVKLPGARSSFWQLLVFCDQETAGGGWMVVQRRADFGEPRESFHRNWIEYRSGFGDPQRELWIGNLNLHLLTTSEDQVLRIELEDFDGEKRYAEYSTFRVASESDGFRLEVSGYSGDAGDALSDPWYGAHGSAFSTHDRDNDRSSLNCASMLKGGWWWKSCGRGLNGIYYDVPQQDSAAVLARQGIVWFRWKGWDYTLKKATMMIRPKSFRPSNSTTFATS